MRLGSQSLVVAGVFVAAGSARASLVTGFESPGYSTGTVVGQNGWTDNNGADAALAGLFKVSTASPKTGSQALSISDGGYNNGFYAVLVSPNTTTGTSSTVTSFSFKISGVTPSNTSGGTSHEIYLVSNAATDIDPSYFGFNNYVGGVNLQSNGTISVQAFVPTGGGGFMSLSDTTSTWTPDVYHTFSISVNAATKDMVYSYDGTPLTIVLFNGTSMTTTKASQEQSVGNFVYRHDTNVAAGERFTLDNLSVAAPEPTSLAVFGAMTLFARRRRSA